MLAVRPPEYFPTLEVAALLAVAERTVLADTFAFSRQAAHNRARIVTAQGALWLSVPRQHAPVGTPLPEVRLVADGWARRHGHALRTAYGMSPYYEHYAPEVAALLAAPYASLAELAVATSRWTARALGAPEPLVASDLPGAPASLLNVWHAAGGGDLVALGASAARDAARLSGVAVSVLALDPAARYRQTFPGWTPGASSLDLLMNLGPEAAAWLHAHARLAPLLASA